MEKSKSIVKVYNETAKEYSTVVETSYDDEYPNTKFALGTLKTRTVFTRFEFLDHKYYEILYGDKASDDKVIDTGGPSLLEK